MARSAGKLTIDVVLGTASLSGDVEKIKAGVRSIGANTKSNMAEATAAVKFFEGNLTNSTRAVSRFLAVTLGLGPALSIAFNVIGPALLAKAIYDTGARVYEFFKGIQEAPKKIATAFRELNAPLTLTNDELRISNDRLANDIAKLEGRRQNTLKLALDEAAKAADALAMSLEKDLSALEKLLKEQAVGGMRKFLGEAGTEDLTKLANQLEADVGKVTDQFAKLIHETTDPKKQNALITEENVRLMRLYSAALDEVKAKSGEGPGLSILQSMVTGVPSLQNTEVRDKALRGMRQYLQSQISAIPLRAEGAELTSRKDELEAQRAAIELMKPYTDKIADLKAKLTGVRTEMAAIGAGPEAEAMARGLANSVKSIEGIAKAWEKTGKTLSAAQKGEIQMLEQGIAIAEMEKEVAKSINDATIRVTEQTRAFENLTRAIGRGYEARKAAELENIVAQQMGARYGQPNSEAEYQRRLALATAERNAADRNRASQATEDLNLQIGLENRLVEVQALGADEIERITALENMRKLIAEGATGAQIVAANTLYYARKRVDDAHGIAQIDAEAAAARRLTVAELEGAEAVRKQVLEEHYLQMARSGHAAEVPAQRLQDEADYQRQITAEAIKTGVIYTDEVEKLDQQIARLKTFQAIQKDNLGIAIAIKNLEDQRLQAIADQDLALRGAKNGIQAFFVEMQMRTKDIGLSLHEALTSALDGVADNLAKLTTGQKANFKAMFQSIAESFAKDQIKAELQRGLGALGRALFPGLGATAVKNDGSDPSRALWVRTVGNLALTPGISMAGGGGPGAGGGLFGRIFGGVTANPYIFNARAEGGPVMAGGAYLVGERGPEPFFPSSAGSIVSNAAARMMGGGTNHYYSIDARGTDPVLTEMRVRSAIIAAHSSSIGTSVQVQADRLRRVPQNS